MDIIRFENVNDESFLDDHGAISVREKWGVGGGGGRLSKYPRTWIYLDFD